jgi:sugar phosphate isomerase/epimerase
VQKAYADARTTWNIEIPSIVIDDLCIYGITNPRNEIKDIAKLSIIKCIDTAEALNIPIIIIPSFYDSEIRNEDDFNTTVGCLTEVCDYAQDKGIIVSTENPLSSEENIRLINSVKRKNFKIFFDTQNPYFYKKFYVPNMIRTLADYICQIHVKDGIEALSGSQLGKGKSDFYKSMEVLKEINYSGWLILENLYDRKPLSLTNEDPAELIKQDIKILKDFFKV